MYRSGDVDMTRSSNCRNIAKLLLVRRCEIMTFVVIKMMHGSEWTLKYDEPEVENVARAYGSFYCKIALINSFKL